MSIALCTHPARCEGMEAAHSVMAAQLADAQGRVQQLEAQLAQRDATIAGLTTDLETARDDVQMYMRMFEQASKGKAVRV